MIDEQLKGVRFLVEKEQFGIYIKEKRLAFKLTQEELAEKLYISATAISKWENGKAYPDITLISQICHVLNISADEFIRACDDTELRKVQFEAKKYRTVKKGVLWGLSLIFPFPVLCLFALTFTVIPVILIVLPIVGLFIEWPGITLGIWEFHGILAILIGTGLSVPFGFLGLLFWHLLQRYYKFISRLYQ